MTETKFCPKCQSEKPISDFYRNRARTDGLGGYCSACQRDSETDRAKRRRMATLNAFGGCCVRCGFSDERALQIDHVNGGGRQEDPSRATAAFYKKVVANPDKYQVLCANCNWIKKFENAEYIGNRVYERVIPTERKQGVGRHNPQANAARAAGLKRWRDENPGLQSMIARETNADPAGRASRSAKQKAYWSEDGEKQREHRRKIQEAFDRKRPH